MLLLAYDIFESENWLGDKKYINFLPTLSQVYTPLVFHLNIDFSLKYARYVFFLSSHLSSDPAELIPTPNIIALTAYSNTCICLKN